MRVCYMGPGRAADTEWLVCAQQLLPSLRILFLESSPAAPQGGRCRFVAGKQSFRKPGLVPQAESKPPCPKDKDHLVTQKKKKKQWLYLGKPAEKVHIKLSMPCPRASLKGSQTGKGTTFSVVIGDTETLR